MEPAVVIENNYKAAGGSFLEVLHEDNCFDLCTFDELCAAVAALTRANKGDHQIAAKMVFILTQTLRHIIYHFDPQDFSRLNDLPDNYSEHVERLSQLVMAYIEREK